METNDPKEGLSESIRSQLPANAICAKLVRVVEQYDCQVLISNAMIGLREMWFMALIDGKKRTTISGQGRCDPSPKVIDQLVGFHWAHVFAGNARYN